LWKVAVKSRDEFDDGSLTAGLLCIFVNGWVLTILIIDDFWSLFRVFFLSTLLFLVYFLLKSHDKTILQQEYHYTIYIM
jgi:hypothetical protein